MSEPKIQAIRGMNDVLPDKSLTWQKVEEIIKNCCQDYGYQEIRLPLIEQTNLFKRTIGTSTDIVEKEMYTFDDLNGDSITLRPEGTAGCVRACLEHGLLHNQIQKLWYYGPMFRHERPQKGRYRQFYQLGVEVFGISGIAVELELIAMCRKMWQELGLNEHIRLEINTIGTLEERQQYRKLLVEFLTPHYEQLDPDSQRRLSTNPLRILDSKNPEVQKLLVAAPKFIDTLSIESQKYFQELCTGLEILGITYTVNPLLVRGLDYYGNTVFEWVTDKLGSQATVCAGGRFDALVEHLGGTQTPAVGFALGLERILLLQEQIKLTYEYVKPDIFFIATGEQELIRALVLAEEIRALNKKIQVVVNLSGGGFKSQFKKADKSNARLALILGPDELVNDTITIKDLRNSFCLIVCC